MKKEIRLLIKETKPYIIDIVNREIKVEVLAHAQKMSKEMATKFYKAIEDFESKLDLVVGRKVQRFFKKHQDSKE